MELHLRFHMLSIALHRGGSILTELLDIYLHLDICLAYLIALLSSLQPCLVGPNWKGWDHRLHSVRFFYSLPVPA